MGVASKFILSIQIIFVGLGCFSAVRSRVLRTAWIPAVLVGPPLFWVLASSSLDLLAIFDALMQAYAVDDLKRRALELPLTIGAALVLQWILAQFYGAKGARSLPWLGIALGVVAILADLLFLLVLVMPV